MRYTTRLETIDDLIGLFDKLFTYVCAKRGLLSQEYAMDFYDRDILQLVEQEMVAVETYVDAMWLSVFDEHFLESVITMKEEYLDPTSGKVISQQKVESIVWIIKQVLISLFTALRTIIAYLFSIKEPEKAPLPFIRNLLLSFGLYEKFLLLPAPVQRKLARLLVHIYKYKGSKYGVKILLKALSFAESDVRELFSYRLNSVTDELSYDGNKENLWFEILYTQEDGSVGAFQINYKNVIDKRWWTQVPSYGFIPLPAK